MIFWTNTPKDAKSLTGCLAKLYFPSYSNSLVYIHTVPAHMARHFPWENFLFDMACPLPHFQLFGMKEEILHLFYSSPPF